MEFSDMKNKVNLIQLHICGRLLFFFLWNVFPFLMFFLILSASYFVMRIYFTILKGVSQQKDNGEPLTTKKKRVQM